MNRFVLFIAVLFIAGAAALRADSLEEILKRMDASAKTFQSFSAKIKQIEYTDVLKETNESSGEIRIKRGKGSLIGLVAFTAPEAKMIHFSGGNLEIFYPKMNNVEIYDVHKYQGAINRWLALGFGTSGTDLRKEYEIKWIGVETVDSTQTTHLRLTPRSPEVQKLATSVDLWIKNGESYPIQEKAVEPSKNYFLYKYSDVQIPAPPGSDFELKLPADVHKVHPAK